MTRHQIRDELFGLTGKRFCLGVINLKKVRPERRPKRRDAVLVDHSTHLGNDFRFKSLWKLGHEQEASDAEHPAMPLPPVLGRQKQAANFAGTVVFLHQVQDFDLFVNTQVDRFVFRNFDLIGVERLETSHLGINC